MANNDNKKKLISTKKLYLLFTVVRKQKTDFFLDLLQEFNVNMQIVTIGNGTSESVIFSDEVGSAAIIMSVITEDNLKKAIKTLKEKIDDMLDGRGICWSVPFDSVMGVTFFNFLSNNKGSII